MHVLVTGVGGFIGAAMASTFLEAGWRVTGLHRRPLAPTHPPRGLESVQTDLLACVGLPDRYDYLVHCAAEVPAFCANEEQLVRTNVEGTANLLRHAEHAGVVRVAFMSSMAVYGATTSAVVDEVTAPVDPGAYGRSKLQGERLLDEWCAATGGRASALRLPGIVGAGARNNFLSDSLLRIRTGQPINARNPDALFNNVVHVADLCAFVLALWETLPVGVPRLTLGATEPTPIREVLAQLYARAGATPAIRWSAPTTTPFLLEFERARTLGFQPATVALSVARFVDDALAAQVS